MQHKLQLVRTNIFSARCLNTIDREHIFIKSKELLQQTRYREKSGGGLFFSISPLLYFENVLIFLIVLLVLLLFGVREHHASVSNGYLTIDITGKCGAAVDVLEVEIRRAG